MNGGVPPTPPNARTGESTPPGITRLARSNSSSDRPMPGVILAPPAARARARAPSGQPVRGFLGVVREDEVGAGSPDRREDLEGGPAAVDPSLLGRGLD